MARRNTAKKAATRETLATGAKLAPTPTKAQVDAVARRGRPERPKRDEDDDDE